jgi:hypothetical protein
MNYSEFCKKVRRMIQALLGPDFNIHLVRIDKLNGVSLQGIVLLRNDRSYAPNIYLDAYFEEFQKGKSVDEIVFEIIEFHYVSEKILTPTLRSVFRFEAVKDRIFYKLANYEKNKLLLSKIPHVRFMDLAVIFCIYVESDAAGPGTITVNNKILEHWNITTDILYSHASINTPRLFKPLIRKMEDIMDTFGLNDDRNVENTAYENTLKESYQSGDITYKKSLMYVASNTTGINGSSYLLLEKEIHHVSEMLQDSLYLLPSSTHEIIILPVSSRPSQEELFHMVKEINETQVAQEEFLADNLYFYDREEKRLSALF